jgi:GNAT superfamily N-acetyltransferase
MPPLQLRKAGVADAALIAGIHLASRAATYRGLMPDDYLDRQLPAEIGPFWEKRLHELEAGAGEAWIAERDGEPIAFACVFVPDADGDVMLENLHARPDRKGLGAGSALLDAAARWALERGARRLVLHVLDRNEGAIGFYEARGWRLAGRNVEAMDGHEIVSRTYVLPLDVR